MSEKQKKDICRPVKHNGLRERGKKLQAIYPELACWQCRNVALAYANYQQKKGASCSDAERDEGFPEYIINLIENKMREMGSWK
ncbi:hypothetical protein AGJ34_21160 [Cronobacter dublinensis subsp. dublinensis]|uniref:hypothetical protein n=1 Tax=Cronobacter dublinensis TaxID=413497 RepID=UPI002A3B1AC6|nr:hypothetical protein [Cronobacter dublinensis subsp. dublinensis]ELY9424942.1 hypothetical protein [Cronobacter dublinensis]EGT5675480.1 hypothetical protein [Cronobacter dublinensis subsp. dublinensis]EGT5688045.1 hypothetical protein [Cronobacter dublinensis subsp. dublinensis]EGT5730133.1 hypothetical protein [Cronobacter dublinensis subsp. dublinensis]